LAVELSIINKTKYRFPSAPFKRALLIGQKFLKLAEGELSLAVISQVEIKRINQLYRGQAEPATVLSFDYGEIVLCPSYIKKKFGVSGPALRDKMVVLFIHGLVHLGGWDHQNDARAKAMSAMEEKILKSYYA